MSNTPDRKNENPVRQLEVKLVDLDWLKGYQNNAKHHPPEQVERIGNSIQRFGFNAPVLARADGTLIAGHGRMLAAHQLKLDKVPCIVLADLNDDEAKAYCLADNRLSDLGEWDESLLKAELLDISEKDLALMLAAGWNEAEFAQLMHDEIGEDLDGKDDEVGVEDGAKAITKLGDVWNLGDHQIICGDSTNPICVGTLLAGRRPHLMVTDPPYGVEYDASWRNEAGVSNSQSTGKVLNDDRADWTEVWNLFPGDVAYVWHASLKTVIVAQSLEKCDFQLRSLITWAKSSLVIGRSHYHFQTEPCWYAVRKGRNGHWNGSRTETNLWEIAKMKRNDSIHSTQKPVECMLRPIVNNSLQGDYIYEPFSGSGTTIIACEQTNRKCLAIELNPLYVDVAIKRWQKITGKKATLEGTDKTYDELAGEPLV
jgi:DNA modification methylase